MNRTLLALSAASVLLAADADLPVQRRVTGQTLTSDEQPRVTITFDPAFHYAGGQRFVLYNVADAEQHFFVDAGPDNQIRRFYWLQFEHYLPDNTHRYNYTPARVADIGGLSFITDTRIYTDYLALKPSPDSDSAKGRALLAAKGYKLPVTAIRARMVHLPGADNRSELMIIYGEALDAAQLPKDAKNETDADDRYPDLAARVLQHARQGLKIARWK